MKGAIMIAFLTTIVDLAGSTIKAVVNALVALVK